MRLGFGRAGDASQDQSIHQDARRDGQREGGPGDLRRDGHPDGTREGSPGDVRRDGPAPPAGTLDKTFASGGFVILPVSGTTSDLALALALDSQGRLVVGGQVNMGISNDLYLARYSSAGVLDSGFGIVKLDLNGGSDTLSALLIDGAGRIVAGGSAAIAGDAALALVRVLPAGTLDPSFASGGKLVLQSSTGKDVIHGLVQDSQGRIVFAASANDEGTFQSGRVTTSGVLDPSYGSASGGKAFATDKASGWAVALASGDRPVLIGRVWSGSVLQNDVGVARFTTSGQLDATFGTNGEVRVDLGNSDDHGWDVAVDKSARLLITGRTKGAGTGQIFVLRLLPDGKPDTSFGTQGVVRVTAGTDDTGYRVLLDGQDRIVVLGEALTPKGVDLAVVRLLPGCQPDSSFGPAGLALIDLDGRDDHPRGLALDGQGRLVICGWIGDSALMDSFLARVLP